MDYLTPLLNRIKHLIEANVIAEVAAQPITTGQDHITVDCTAWYKDGDYVLIFPNNSDGTAYFRQVMVKPNDQLWLDKSIPEDMPTAHVMRSINGSFIKRIYIGDSDRKEFPSIVIDASNGDVYDEEMYTIGGLAKRHYPIEISCFVDSADYQRSFNLCLAYAEEIHSMLMMRVSPGCDYVSGIVSTVRRDPANGTVRRFYLRYDVTQVLQRLQREPNIFEILNQ